jgi:hypothetical protein
VRGTLRESEYVDGAPHPDLLPVKNGEKEKSHNFLFFALTAIAAAAVRFSTPSLE